jgi:PAS domain S-box-containing protein
MKSLRDVAGAGGLSEQGMTVHTAKEERGEDSASGGFLLTMDELREITEHLLRFSPDALIVVDDRGCIRFANDTVRDVFGYDPAALLGKSVDTLVPQRLRAHHGQHIAGFMRTPNNREMGARLSDLFALRADGSEFSAGIRLAPFRIGAKLFVGAAIRDMTERRIVADELVMARTEAERQSGQEPVPRHGESRSASADAGHPPAQRGHDEDRAGC